MATLVKYKYLGLGTVVEVDYPTPEVKLSLWAAGLPPAPALPTPPTSPTYPALDRFGRVIDHRWTNHGQNPNVDVAHIQHGYDRNSNRLWRQNDVARALDKKFDQQYAYDCLNRLNDFKQGLLNGSHVIPPGSNTTFQQQWSLDYVGNWSCFKQDNNGSGSFGLQQTRTANPVNEITNIGATTGPVWTTPQYDPAGNTTNFPQPADPTKSFTAVYDAWNRIVRVIDNETSDIVQENAYDGRGFRIIKKTYDEGALTETRHIYHTSGWQAIEERLGANPDSADPERQYVWGIRYIDDLTLRDRDTSEPPDGTLNERLYFANDTQFSISTLIGTDGAVLERYEYSPYGHPTILNPDFTGRGPSSYDNQYLFTGRPLDTATGLYDFRHRPYSYILGCFTTRDPLEYPDGQNSYAAYHVMHGGVDPTGLWKVNRNGGAWARAVPERRDTIRTLAQHVHLNADEYDKWIRLTACTGIPGNQFPNYDIDTYESLRPHKASNVWSLDHEVRDGCPCSILVPNTVGVYVAKRRWSDVSVAAAAMRASARRSATFLRGNGKKVVLVDPGASDDRFKQIWREDGIYYIIYGGHGTELGLQADPYNGTAVNASEVSPPYKLAIIALFACASADAHPTGIIRTGGTADKAGFRQHISNTGAFMGYHGNVWILSGNPDLYEGPGGD